MKIRAATRLNETQQATANVPMASGSRSRTPVSAALAGRKIGTIINKVFSGATLSPDLQQDVDDDERISRGMFFTSTSQVEMGQLHDLEKAGLKVTGVSISKKAPGKLAISFTC